MFNHIQHDFPKLLQENVDGTRCYVTPSGEKYPSVTTVLAEYGKEGIDAWKKKVGEKEAARVSRQATSRGTAVHAAIEHYLHNRDTSELEMLPNAKELFVKMKQELTKLNNIHCLETKLFSHELQLAGTVDCIAEYNGVLSVIDFKTSRRLKKKEQIGNYFMQGTAYASMFREMTGLDIKQIIILIGVDGVPFCQTMKEHPDNHIDELKTYINKYREKQQWKS